VILGDIADGLTRGVETTVSTVSEAFFEPVVRLGVTGLSRSGKTVFITSLIANLLDRGRMPGLRAAAEGRIDTVWLQPQPDDTVPRFDFEAHLGDLTGTEPRWPESTSGISELRLSFRVRPKGLLSGITGPRTLHLDIVDYPGEWLLDLGLLDKDFDTWSREVLARFEGRDEGQEFLTALADMDPNKALDEVTAKALAGTFADALIAMRAGILIAHRGAFCCRAIWLAHLF
jgi:predicted YcjX-like family ATPase